MNSRMLLRVNLWQNAFNRMPRRNQQSLLNSTPLLQQHIYTGLAGGGLNNSSRRNFMAFANKKHLKKLEKEANASPGDVYRQLRFLKELNQNYPALVIQRVEQTPQKFANQSEEIMKEYIKALVRTGRIDKTETSELLRRLQSSANGNTFQGSVENIYNDPSLHLMKAVGASRGGGQSVEDPVYVSMVGGEGANAGANSTSFKSNLWKIGRSLAVTFLLVSAFGALLDEKGLGDLTGGGAGAKNKKFGLRDPKVMAKNGEKETTFDDIKGADEAKQEVQEIVAYLKDPERFTRLGGKLPKGVLLTGPPGTGKTLLARAIAGEAEVPFFHTSGSEFEEVYVGVGARRIRDLFEAAKKKSPCIIFIDEIDAVGGTRQSKDTTALKMTLNQLLVEMDGFSNSSGVIVIGATNFPRALDSALVRPGRFDRHVAVALPDVGGRLEILKLYTSQLPSLASDVDLEVFARGTPGMSGADLSNLVNEAALYAALTNCKQITRACFEYAMEKLLMGGPERTSAVISPESAKKTAYHEGGHALVALNTPGTSPLYKATIMPRGQALGMVSYLPEGDQTSVSKKQLLARLDVCMGGRVAEELIFGEDNATGGCSSDLEQATNVARAMVTKYGMSDEVGFVTHDDKSSAYSRGMIDKEVRKLCDEAYHRAKKILVENKADLHRLAQGLIEYETLTNEDIQLVLKGKKLNRKVTNKGRN